MAAFTALAAVTARNFLGSLAYPQGGFVPGACNFRSAGAVGDETLIPAARIGH
jgi:hypothetical protein